MQAPKLEPEIGVDLPIANTNVVMHKKAVQLPEIVPETTYEFCGDGAGVPGLPHTVTAEEAWQLGVADTLRAALAAGNYRAAQPPAPNLED